MYFRYVLVCCALLFVACVQDYSPLYFENSQKVMQSSATLDEALKAYDASVKHNPHSPDYYNARGDIEYKFGDYGYAVNDYTQSLRNETNSEVNIKRGKAYMKLRFFEDAAVDFTSVIDRHNQYLYQGYVERAKAYIEMGMNKEALRDLEKVRKKQGDSPEINIAMGEAYLKLGDLDKAKNYVQLAIMKQQDNPELYMLRGKLYYKTKDPNQAIADFKKVLELDKFSNSAKLELARIYATCPVDIYRDGKKAVEMAQEVYSVTDDIDALIVLSEGYAAQGNFDKAIELLDSKIEETKDYVKQDDMRVYKRAYQESRIITGW